MSFSAVALGAVLDRLVPPGATGLVVAVSGGLDSSCLATAAVELGAAARAGAAPALPLRALHVDHGLQAAAGAFRDSCLLLCRHLGLPLGIVAAQVDAGAGVSVEAAARTARYAALAAALAPGECLLTAHHLEDQAETLMLQALRGAGPKGLSCMPARRALGPGWHLRPLLAVPRSALAEFGRTRAIAAVADPMNVDARFDRSYLRAAVWPPLERRWPGAGAALARVAEHAAEAQDLLDALADADLAALRDGVALSLPRLRALTHARQVNALRRWVALAGVAAPPAARLAEALRQILEADADHLPAVAWGGHALRRYRERVHLTAAAPPRTAAALAWNWRAQPTLELGDGLGRLHAVERRGGLAAQKLGASLSVRRRSGGERLRTGPAAATHSVQHLCQALGVLPWMRDALPCVYAGGELVAIGDLWTDAGSAVAAAAPGIALTWEGGPNLF